MCVLVAVVRRDGRNIIAMLQETNKMNEMEIYVLMIDNCISDLLTLNKCPLLLPCCFLSFFHFTVFSKKILLCDPCFSPFGLFLRFCLTLIFFSLFCWPAEYADSSGGKLCCFKSRGETNTFCSYDLAFLAGREKQALNSSENNCLKFKVAFLRWLWL